MIRLENVSKFYYTKGVIAVGFSKINLNFDVGEFVAITGESGSGKSTLLNVISGLDTYEEGEMYVNGEETSHYTEKDFEDYRRKYIGNIFQNFNLVNSYTVYQNIALVMQLSGTKNKDIKKRVNELIDKVGLTEYKNTKASKLSGGQKQRVAIARALAKDTPIIIADEPTGNLDSESAAGIIELLASIAKEKLVIIVTHNYDQVAPYVTRKIKMHDGKVLEDSVVNTREEKVEDTALTEEYKNTRFFTKVRLGIRNAFNIPIKFLLLTFVFIFITVALTMEIGIFQSEKWENGILGYSWVFDNTSANRIIVKNVDKNKEAQAFTQADIDKISKMDNVGRLITQDLFVDAPVSLESVDDNDYAYIYGNAVSVDEYKDITPDYGRMPEKDDELLIIATKNNYYLSLTKKGVNELFGQELYDSSVHFGDKKKNDNTYKVVGVKIMDAKDDVMLNSHSILIAGTNKFLNDRLLTTNYIYSKTYVTLGNAKDKASDNYYPMYTVMFSNKVEPGTAWVSTNYNYNFKSMYCVGENVNIRVENTYYEDSLDLKIAGTYNKAKFKEFMDLEEWQTYEDCDGFIFINVNDYNSLFEHDTYQMSVFVSDEQRVEETAEALRDAGYDTLVIKDTLQSEEGAVIMELLTQIVTVTLAIVLLIISYFVIRIILKSRNVYYSTVRMLGGNTSVCRDLLVIDLLVDANLAYIISMAAFHILYKFFPDVYVLNNIAEFVTGWQFAAVYLIVVLISVIISIRYASKLFKKSTMVTIKEEV